MQENSTNPKNFDKRMKNYCINQNIYNSGYGTYKVCPYTSSIKFDYLSAYDPGPATSICNVFIFHDHALSVLDNAVSKGQNTTSHPVVMYPTGREFTGTNIESREGIYDETILLRTNYAFVVKKNSIIFPVKGDSEVIYTKLITVIRDAKFNFLQLDGIFKIGIVAIFPPNNIEILGDGDERVMSSKHLIKFQLAIEALFQVCISGEHDTLVLSPFDDEFKIPYNDQILVYNYCILKYGHKFKSIIVAVPQHFSQQTFRLFSKSIIRPNEITQEIDTKYETENLKNKILQ